MSSPQMTRMFGFVLRAGVCCACVLPAKARLSGAMNPMTLPFMVCLLYQDNLGVSRIYRSDFAGETMLHRPLGAVKGRWNFHAQVFGARLAGGARRSLIESR